MSDRRKQSEDARIEWVRNMADLHGMPFNANEGLGKICWHEAVAWADANNPLKAQLAEAQKWAYHYQLRKTGGMSGQAITSYVCANCFREDLHANTNIPIFCKDCTSEIRNKLKSGGG